jgi:hypothetical protein
MFSQRVRLCSVVAEILTAKIALALASQFADYRPASHRFDPG